MTEIGNRSSRSKAGAKGVKIERIYTTPGVHPYDEVTWEKRDVVQQNWKTGETIFEQRGVEFPDFWSVNASTIVTTKYFRGALGTDQREWSLRQLIDRVVGKYTTAGKENGYGLIGGSVIIAPTGEIAARALGEDDEVIAATLDLELGDYIRRTIFNFEKHRRIEHYKLITERTGAIPPP